MSSEVVDLLVVGSANLDIVVPVDHHPVKGETVLGGDHALVPGGKGANQAVAASRLGAAVRFVGQTGDDSAGRTLRSSLAEANVDLDDVTLAPDSPSGIALITVAPDGDNAIVVSPGANARLTPDHVRAAAARIEAADAVLLQLEVPIDTVRTAAEIAQGLVVLDPAPAPHHRLPTALLDAVDVLVPNETELARLTGAGTAPADTDRLAELARSLPVERVVVSLGSRGALAVEGLDSTLVGAPVVNPVDTTGAGDAFRAALTLALVRGESLVEATTWAVRVGAATTLRAGAQPSLPTEAEVDHLLSRP